jgi:peptidoglycan-associated lipoprotein
MMSIRKLSLCALGLGAALVAGCAAPPPPKQVSPEARLPDPGPDNAYRVEWPDMGRGEDRYIGLTIGADLADICHLPKMHFEFDSAEPLPQDKFQLAALADCLRSPRLEGARITVIGRADARGAPAYNDALALRRAVRIKELLVSQGVPATRIATESTGEHEAVGNQPMYSYGYDRRVDIVLVGAAHAPR